MRDTGRMQTLSNYINGQLVGPASGQYLDNYDPATGEIYSRTPDSDSNDVTAAVEAASGAFGGWSSVSAGDRSQLLLKIADLIEARLEELARAESIDSGKPVHLAKAVDIPRAAANFRFFASAATQFASECHDMDGQALNYTLRKPIGIAGCISPWNLPLYLFTWKVAPALAMGNCVIGKPSEITPVTAFLFSEICREAGLPPGVLNIVHGYGHKVGSAIVSHPEVGAISFTGSTRTGAEIAKTAGPMFKKLSLEMGGKNPNIIFADCDYETMMASSLKSSFSNQGQICLCGSRIFVEEPLYEAFRDDFVQRARQLRIGDPLAEETHLGAVVSKTHLEKILHYIELAQSEGGQILTGGKQRYLEGRCSQGWFIEPTVVANLPQACRTNQEEIFGPVVTIMPFRNEEEMLRAANQTEYGLAASVWTENLSRAHRVARALQSGIVWINCWMVRDLRTPFGGVKNSGVGREGGQEALRFFTEPQNICVKL